MPLAYDFFPRDVFAECLVLLPVLVGIRRLRVEGLPLLASLAHDTVRLNFHDPVVFL